MRPPHGCVGIGRRWWQRWRSTRLIPTYKSVHLGSGQFSEAALRMLNPWPLVPSHALGSSIVERVPDLDSHANSGRRPAQDIEQSFARDRSGTPWHNTLQRTPVPTRALVWDWQAHRLLAQCRHAASWLLERALVPRTHRQRCSLQVAISAKIFWAPGSAGGAGGCCAGGAGNAC